MTPPPHTHTLPNTYTYTTTTTDKPQGTLMTAGLDGLVRVWQPLETPVPGAVLESAPVYSHPPDEEDASGRPRVGGGGEW